jgi:cyanate permease
MMRYLGQGSLTLIPGALVPQWFEKRRALAISLMTTGTILGTLIVPALNLSIIQNYSWQTAWRMWSVLALVVLVPLMALFVINKPEDIGLLPDNKAASDAETLQAEMDKMIATSWTLKEALRTKEFWLIGLISMIMPMVNTGLMFHFFSIMKLQGIDSSTAAIVIGLVALPGFFMPIFAGTIVDRYRSKFIILIALVVITLDFLFLNIVHSFITGAIFMLVLGLANNMQGVTLNVIWVKYFGRMHLGSIRGAAAVFGVIGSALGPLPFGLSYDLTGSYTTILFIVAGLTFTGAIMAASIKRPVK